MPRAVAQREPTWRGQHKPPAHCLKSLVICDSRFESQIAIAVKSRDLEHLGLDGFFKIRALREGQGGVGAVGEYQMIVIYIIEPALPGGV